MFADQFTQFFREAQRRIRDTLLELIPAFQNRDKGRIEFLLKQAATLTGPHFRYEEETLYPALVDIFGKDYVEELLRAHDRAIKGAKRMIELAGHDPLTDEGVEEATRLTRNILPHVSDCDGLSIMVERLPDRMVQGILDARDSSQRAGLDLLQWADQVRNRPASVPE